MRLLSTMLAVPSWRCSLDLDSQEAVSLTSVLLREESAALNGAADGETMTKVTPLSNFFPCANSCLDWSCKQGVRGPKYARSP